MRLASSCRFGFTKETNHFVRDWDSTVAICRFSFGGPNYCVTVSNDACGTIQALSTVEVVRRGIEPFLDRKMKQILWPSPPSDWSGHLHRQYYRIVSEDVSEPVLFTTNISDLFAVLNDIIKVLYSIHSCRGLLGELDYAKPKSDDLPHELRTGTLDFMAIEAIGRRYYFNTKDTADVEKQKKSQILWKVKGNAASTEGPTSSEKPAKKILPFFHNKLHDMESLWWTFIWKLFFHRDNSRPEVDENKVEARQSAFRKLFPKYLTTEHRREFFRVEEIFYEMLVWLDESLSDVKEQLDFLRLHLHTRYQQFERTFPEYTFDAFQGVQATFQEHLEYCAKYASGIEPAPFKTTGL